VVNRRMPGERAGLSRDGILDAALALVDSRGLAGLSMRALAAELGVEAMSLYHHVPNKDALIDGLVERLFVPAGGAAQGADWRTLLRDYARDLRGALLRHPALLPVITRPAATGPTLDAVERALGVLTAAGFPLGRALDALNTVTVFVIGHASAEVAIGTPDPVAVDGRPLLAQAMATGAGADDAQRFEFAVEALLTGFAAVIPREPAPSTPPRASRPGRGT
jgi:AcrR family transcriptional regulator